MDPEQVSSYIIESDQSISSDYKSDGYTPPASSLEASQCGCGLASCTASHPAGRRPDAIPLDNQTDNLRTSTDTGSKIDVSVDRTKRYATSSYPFDEPQTVELPELTDWKSRRDFVSIVTSHFKRFGLVGERACGCGGGLYVAEPVCRLETWGRPDLDEYERRLKVEGIRRCGVSRECLECALVDDMRLCRSIYHTLMAHTLQGGSTYFLTLTVPHRADDPAHLLADLLAQSWTRLNKHRNGYFKVKRGVVTWLRVMETTFGKHGLHPHYHVALCFDRLLDGTQENGGKPDLISQRLPPSLDDPLPHEHPGWSWDEASVYCASLFADWKRIVEELAPKILGREVKVSYKAQDFRSMGTVGSLPAYLAKAGMGAALELGYTTGKQARHDGRSVLELVRDICLYGRSADVRLWLEYRHMVAGRRLYSTSTGVRNPKHLFESVEVPPMPDPEPEFDEAGRSLRWVLVDEGEPFLIPGWVYLALYKANLWLKFTHHAERLGRELLVEHIDKCWIWFDDQPPDDNRAFRVAVKLMCRLARLDDVPPGPIPVS